MSNFSLSIITSHGHELNCATYVGTARPGAKVTLPCTGTGRYIHFKRLGGPEVYLVVICEMIIIGFKHIGKDNMIVSDLKSSPIQF